MQSFVLIFAIALSTSLCRGAVRLDSLGAYLVSCGYGGSQLVPSGQYYHLPIVANGKPAHLIVDTGSPTSVIFRWSLKQCIDKSLQRLKLDRIDLYQLHTVDRKVPIEDSLGALKAAQGAGKIRHVGLSNVSVKEIERAKTVVPIVSIQNRYNLTDRDSEDVLKYCEKEKMGFLPWAPVGGSGRSSLGKNGSRLEEEAKGRNVTTFQLALAWLLWKSPVMLPIPGTSKLEHLEQNMAAGKIQLTDEEWKRIEALS